MFGLFCHVLCVLMSCQRPFYSCTLRIFFFGSFHQYITTRTSPELQLHRDSGRALLLCSEDKYLPVLREFVENIPRPSWSDGRGRRR